MEHRDLSEQMELLMKQHIMPELMSPTPYIRWRAIWFYGQFEDYVLKDQEHIHQVVDSVYKNLFDTHLVVKVESAVTLYKLLDQSDEAKCFLRPALSELVNELLKIL